jgi:hypothetical protein
MDVHFVGYSVQFRREVFDCGLYEQNVWEPAFLRFSMNFLGYLFQRASVGIHPDVKLPGVPAGALVYKETVSRPDVDHHSLAGRER